VDRWRRNPRHKPCVPPERALRRTHATVVGSQRWTTGRAKSHRCPPWMMGMDRNRAGRHSRGRHALSTRVPRPSLPHARRGDRSAADPTADRSIPAATQASGLLCWDGSVTCPVSRARCTDPGPTVQTITADKPHPARTRQSSEGPQCPARLKIPRRRQNVMDRWTSASAGCGVRCLPTGLYAADMRICRVDVSYVKAPLRGAAWLRAGAGAPRKPASPKID
jgi:hypothetical protein